MSFPGHAKTDKDFGPAPKGYVAGLRGPTGLSAIVGGVSRDRKQKRAQPAKAPARADEEETARFDEFSGFQVGLFSSDAVDQEDEEADDIYSAIDARMSQRSKKSRKPETSKQETNKTSLSSGATKHKAVVSMEEWEAMPEARALTKREKATVPEGREHQWTYTAEVLRAKKKDIANPEKSDRGAGRADREEVVGVLDVVDGGLAQPAGQGHLSSGLSVVAAARAALAADPAAEWAWVVLIDSAESMEQKLVICSQGLDQIPDSEALWLKKIHISQSVDKSSAPKVIASALEAIGSASSQVWLKAIDFEKVPSARLGLARSAVSICESPTVELYATLLSLLPTSDAEGVASVALEAAKKFETDEDLWIAACLARWRTRKHFTESTGAIEAPDVEDDFFLQTIRGIMKARDGQVKIPFRVLVLWAMQFRDLDELVDEIVSELFDQLKVLGLAELSKLVDPISVVRLVADDDTLEALNSTEIRLPERLRFSCWRRDLGTCSFSNSQYYMAKVVAGSVLLTLRAVDDLGREVDGLGRGVSGQSNADIDRPIKSLVSLGSQFVSDFTIHPKGDVIENPMDLTADAATSESSLVPSARDQVFRLLFVVFDALQTIESKVFAEHQIHVGTVDRTIPREDQRRFGDRANLAKRVVVAWGRREMFVDELHDASKRSLAKSERSDLRSSRIDRSVAYVDAGSSTGQNVGLRLTTPSDFDGILYDTDSDERGVLLLLCERMFRVFVDIHVDDWDVEKCLSLLENVHHLASVLEVCMDVCLCIPLWLWLLRLAMNFGEDLPRSRSLFFRLDFWRLMSFSPWAVTELCFHDRRVSERISREALASAAGVSHVPGVGASLTGAGARKQYVSDLDAGKAVTVASSLEWFRPATPNDLDDVTILAHMKSVASTPGSLCVDCCRALVVLASFGHVKPDSVSSSRLMPKGGTCACCKQAKEVDECQVLFTGALCMLLAGSVSRAKSLLPIAVQKANATKPGKGLSKNSKSPTNRGTLTTCNSLVTYGSLMTCRIAALMLMLDMDVQVTSLRDAATRGSDLVVGSGQSETIYNLFVLEISEFDGLLQLWNSAGCAYLAYIAKLSRSRPDDLSAEHAWFSENLEKIPKVVCCYIASALVLAFNLIPSKSALCEKYSRLLIALVSDTRVLLACCIGSELLPTCVKAAWDVALSRYAKDLPRNLMIPGLTIDLGSSIYDEYTELIQIVRRPAATLAYEELIAAEFRRR